MAGKPGRPKGSKNKLTGAQQDILAAWHKVAGPKTAEKLVRTALKDAIEGHGVIKESADGASMTKYLVRDCELLKVIMPYMARRLDGATIDLHGNGAVTTFTLTLGGEAGA